MSSVANIDSLSRTIVVGTDGSGTADRAVAEAILTARALDARLEIVSAYAPASGSRTREEARGVPSDIGWMVHERSDVSAMLDAARAKAIDAGVPAVRWHARRGDPADAILGVAKECDAQLIVVGSKGMSSPRRFLLGSVPNTISHNAQCSVLIVRTT